MPKCRAVAALKLRLEENERSPAETQAILELRELTASPAGRKRVRQKEARPETRTFLRHLERMVLPQAVQLYRSRGSREKNPSSATTPKEYPAQMLERF